VQRPDGGVQPEFDTRCPVKGYHYDSSLAPELCWDKNAEREMAEWLLGLIAEAAEKDEQTTFAEPQVWKEPTKSSAPWPSVSPGSRA